ncbi:MAG: 50S ribosomal protein L13 [Candidatus Woesearchaeota archaeon]
MIIDGSNLIMGRLAAYVAKKALLGEQVDIVNSENVVITGSKAGLLERYKNRRERGTPSRGPFFPRTSHLMLKRAIRGMLPYKYARGSEALKRIKCFQGVPPRFADQKFETIEKANKSKLQTKKYITLRELANLLGAK